MDWSEERYARIYTRDTADLLAFGWEGRLVWYELVRKVDRAGVLDHGGDIDVVAELLRVPVEIFNVGIARIAKRGSARLNETAIIIPNYIEAQEAEQSDRQRQRESRARRRDRALANGADPAAAKAAARPDLYGGRTVTPRDPVTSPSVTDGHARSRAVTSGHSVPDRTVPDLTVPCRAEGEPAQRTRGRPKSELPAGWAPAPDQRVLAAELGVSLEREAAKFRDHALANGRRAVRWDSAFAGWLRKAAELGSGTNGHRGVNGVRDRAAELMAKADRLEAEGR